jgi:hypothetical protein
MHFSCLKKRINLIVFLAFINELIAHFNCLKKCIFLIFFLGLINDLIKHFF